MPTLGKMPSKAQMKKDELQWQAESLVSTAMKDTPQYKKAVKATLKEIQGQESVVKKIVAGGQRPSSQKNKPAR